MMTDEQKARVRKLIKALRSGEFEQGTGRLKSIDRVTKKESFCCLGVACELFRQETEKGRWNDEDSRGYPAFIFGEGIAGESMLLPDQVREWYGFEERNPSIHKTPFPGQEIEPAFGEGIAGFNDSKVPFPEIADILEKEFLSDASV